MQLRTIRYIERQFRLHWKSQLRRFLILCSLLCLSENVTVILQIFANILRLMSTFLAILFCCYLHRTISKKSRWVWSASQERWFSSSTLLIWDPAWNAASGSGAPNTRRTCWRELCKVHKMGEVWRDHPSYQDRLRELGCSDWRQEVSRETFLQPSSI